MTEKVPVMCLRCFYVWKTNAKVVRCPKCKSAVWEKIENVPKTFKNQEIKALKTELSEYKEWNQEILKKLLTRIKALEKSNTQPPTPTPKTKPVVKKSVEKPVDKNNKEQVPITQPVNPVDAQKEADAIALRRLQERMGLR